MLMMKKIYVLCFCTMLLMANIALAPVYVGAGNMDMADSYVSSSAESDDIDSASNIDSDLILRPTIYQCTDDSYDLETAQVSDEMNPIGTLYLSDDAIPDENDKNVPSFSTDSEKMSIFYHFDKQTLEKKKTEWHLVSDNFNKINGQKISSDIDMGAILIESSFDGNNWVKSKDIIDYFSKERKNSIYEPNAIQLLNGCYFRITVVYQEEIKVGTKKGVFGRKKDKNKSRYIAEVYELFASNGIENSGNVSSPSDEPHNVWDEKYVNVVSKKYAPLKKAKKGLLKNKEIGHFTINGYSQKEKESDNSFTFFKDVGDQVTLWFTLDQDINEINNNDDIKVVSDKANNDEESELEKGNMGRGTLIVKYTDTSNQEHKPVVYSDYLAACSTTSADTKVVLYEEGDYDIILDYKVHRSIRKGPKTSYYKMKFRFSIRNGNTMIYPFDVSTGAELSNQAITPNGFKIDFANSKALNIYVTRTDVIENDDKHHVEDVRSKEPAKDGEAYTKEGIYTLQIVNQYTKQETIKTIFVGKNKFMKALSRNGISVKELDAALQQGYKIKNDGTLYK